MNNHAPHAGSSAKPFDLQSSLLPLCYGCPRLSKQDDLDCFSVLLYICIIKTMSEWCFRPRFFIVKAILGRRQLGRMYNFNILLHPAIGWKRGPIRYTGTTWANEMNFCMNHAPGAGSITHPFNLQSSVLQLLLQFTITIENISYMHQTKGLVKEKNCQSLRCVYNAIKRIVS